MSAAEPSPHVAVRRVSKRYGPLTVLDRVDLTVARGELVTLLGPSGCGKTTLLRLVAGLATPEEGTIAIAGRDLTRVPPHRRNVGVVFQSYALFPHLTVAGNVAFGLVVRGRPRAEIDRIVARTLDLVRLGHLGDRRISALSGGQQQRVALARALAVEPEVLLFDEALSALDRNLREDMQVELRRLLREIGATAIFVTHDQDEALTMSDRIAVMNRGRIEQLADPKTLYERPATLFTLGFVGQSTRLRGTVAEARDGMVTVETAVGRVSAAGQYRAGSAVVVATRPEHLRVLADTAGHEGADQARNRVDGHIRSVIFQGSRSRIEVAAGDQILLAEAAGRAAADLKPGDAARLVWPVSETFAYPDPEVRA